MVQYHVKFKVVFRIRHASCLLPSNCSNAIGYRGLVFCLLTRRRLNINTTKKSNENIF